MIIDHIFMQSRGRRWAQRALVLAAEAVVFGIGLEVSKDLYRLMRQRVIGEEEGQDLPPPDEVDDGL